MNASDVTVSAHQLNFAPGASVIDRISRADIVIWLDGAQYVRHGFVNRNRFSDGSWMTVPVNEHDTFAPINKVRISDPTGRAREKIARTIEHRLGAIEATPFARELRRPYKLLAGLNYALIQRVCEQLGLTVAHTLQSFLDTEPLMPVVTDEPVDVGLVRDRYADMAAQLGATVWLSGPGRHHGDAARFAERGIRIEYTDPWDGPNPCALELARSAA